MDFSLSHLVTTNSINQREFLCLLKALLVSVERA